MRIEVAFNFVHSELITKAGLIPPLLAPLLECINY